MKIGVASCITCHVCYYVIGEDNELKVIPNSLTGAFERLFCTALSKGEREIVFELIAKSYHFERGFFIERKLTPLPSPPPWGGNNDLRHTEQSEVSQTDCV